MTAYIIADIIIDNEEAMMDYRPIAAKALLKHNGRMLALGEPETLEGDWRPRRMVVVEFPDIETARAWFTSPEYAPALEIRRRSATARLLALDGLKGVYPGFEGKDVQGD
jgi:uncharacterized protein (DUF1330 family)